MNVVFCHGTASGSAVVMPHFAPRRCDADAANGECYALRSLLFRPGSF